MILHSKIIGEGVPFLILHGYLGMGDNWKSLGSRFGKNFQVHLIDQRNHGRSFHSDNFDYGYLVEDLFGYIRYHNLSKIILLGHSMGGKTAMFFSVRYPELIDKLIIVDISPKYYQPHHGELLAALNSIDFSIQNSRKLVDQKLAEQIPATGVRSFLLKSLYWKNKGLLAFRFNLQTLTEKNAEIGKALPSSAVFEGETLFLIGGNSDYVVNNEVFTIKKQFIKAVFKTIKNAGHWLHAERPDLLYDSVMVFLD